MTALNALIADDEPLLREQLVAQLARLWPELQVVAQARNGREAVELFDEHQPQVVFLDVHMPGLNGVEVARCIDRRAEVVFVTAFDRYAVDAFRHGAVDYLVKPLETERLRDTVQRLQARLREPTGDTPRPEYGVLLERLAEQLRQNGGVRSHLQWIKASVGNSVRLIPVEQVLYLRADAKYTVVAWEGGEALIRTPIRELADALDPSCFAQIHRSAIVNLAQVDRFSHGPGDSGEVHLKGRGERLSVSRSYVHLFRQM
ncbi:MAG: LytTR family DNA-binding domain-containing protein [Burkholderiales bacterium]|nr:LytTR family DNA-binding domain-containing protein [Burkholderiales bacterium]